MIMKYHNKKICCFNRPEKNKQKGNSKPQPTELFKETLYHCYFVLIFVNSIVGILHEKIVFSYLVK